MKQFYIPFMGFYESVHDQVIDAAINQICEKQDNGDTNDGLVWYLSSYINFNGVFTDYARDYVDNFSNELNIKGLKFIKLDSPREYNFTTDKILCECSDNEFYSMFRAVKGELLESICRENLTSRSGFASFYNPDYTTWGNWKTWDNNQLSQVIEAYVQYMDIEHGVTFDEYEIMERSTVNGVIGNIINKNCKPEIMQRVCKIADYLTVRARR
jgi:hypothetical protein